MFIIFELDEPSGLSVIDRDFDILNIGSLVEYLFIRGDYEESKPPGFADIIYENIELVLWDLFYQGVLQLWQVVVEMEELEVVVQIAWFGQFENAVLDHIEGDVTVAIGVSFWLENYLVIHDYIYQGIPYCLISKNIIDRQHQLIIGSIRLLEAALAGLFNQFLWFA